jgi:hypothetical protein
MVTNQTIVDEYIAAQLFLIICYGSQTTFIGRDILVPDCCSARQTQMFL